MTDEPSIRDWDDKPSEASSSGGSLQLFRLIVVGVSLLWLILLVDYLLPIDLVQFGLQPRSIYGLIGIITMPLLHNGIGHLISNTIPLILLLALVAGSRARAGQIILEIALLGGVLLWIFGRSFTHVGASGLVYGLIGFLLAAGYWERRPLSIVIALFVLFFFGGALFWGVLPGQQGVSWDGHLTGALAGGLVARFHCRSNTASN